MDLHKTYLSLNGTLCIFLVTTDLDSSFVHKFNDIQSDRSVMLITTISVTTITSVVWHCWNKLVLRNFSIYLNETSCILLQIRIHRQIQWYTYFDGLNLAAFLKKIIRIISLNLSRRAFKIGNNIKEFH